MKKIYPEESQNLQGKTREVIWVTRNPNKIFGTHEKNFRAFQIKIGSSSRINENNYQKNSKNSRETLLIGKHILKDTHIPKLNILGCDNL
jgi:hypothetical protein